MDRRHFDGALPCRQSPPLPGLRSSRSDAAEKISSAATRGFSTEAATTNPPPCDEVVLSGIDHARLAGVDRAQDGIAHEQHVENLFSSTPGRQESRLYSLVFYVPESHVEEVKQAVFDAGAGRIGNYDCCAWQVLGTGQFQPVEGSRPFLGARDRLERVDEFRVEMVCDDESIGSVVRALREAHPYEEPAFHFWRVNEML